MFVTTGTQLPFPRLLDAVNLWAAERQEVKVIAQNAQPDDSNSKTWQHLETHAFLTPSQYSNYCDWADVIVGHAGMGTIITGFENQKPLVLMPRLFALGEHRNDHQLSTAKKFEDRQSIQIVTNEQELKDALSKDFTTISAENDTNENRERLIATLHALVQS